MASPVDEHFKTLETALKAGRFVWTTGAKSRWEDEKGESIPTPSADDFMLMRVRDDGTLDFKHRDTRNYLFVLPDGRMLIPDTGAPFALGHF